MTGAARIEAYLEARRALVSYRQAVQDDGNPRRAVILEAQAEVRRTEAQLTGGQLGHARRLLATHQMAQP